MMVNLETSNEEFNKRLQFVCDLLSILSRGGIIVLGACGAEASLSF